MIHYIEFYVYLGVSIKHTNGNYLKMGIYWVKTSYALLISSFIFNLTYLI